MNPIIDINLLRHHRVDYGPRVDFGIGKRAPKMRSNILALAAWVPVFLAFAVFASWGA